MKINTGIGEKTPTEALEYILNYNDSDVGNLNVLLSMLRGLYRNNCMEIAQALVHITSHESRYPGKVIRIVGGYIREYKAEHSKQSQLQAA